MKIGIDMDDVLVHFIPEVLEYHNKTYGTKVTMNDVKDYSLAKIWGCSEKESNRRIEEFYRSNTFKQLSPIQGAVDGVKKLQRMGHQLELITSRPEYLRDISLVWINKHIPDVFNELHFVNSFTDYGVKRKKSEVCVERNIDLHIDDHLFHANDCASQGVKVLLFDQNYGWNQSLSLRQEIKRVHSWDNIVTAVKRKESTISFVYA